MKRLIAALPLAVLAPLLAAGPIQAAPSADYVARAVWLSEAKNTPRPGRSTITQTFLLVRPVSRGYEVCLQIDVSEESTSGHGARDSVKIEDGCTIQKADALTVATDLGSASLTASVRVTETIVTCPPETPDDCVITDGPARTVAVRVNWTAVGPAYQFCVNPGVGPLRDFRDAVATGTIDSAPLGTSEQDPELTFLSRIVARRC